MRKQKPPAICPVCAEDVPANAVACPECGADYKSGWREDAETYDGIGIPDEFNYHDFTKREFGSSAKPTGIRTIWWLTAIVLVVALLYLIFKLAF